MKNSTSILAIPGAALVLGLAAWGVVYGQPSPLPPTPRPEEPVAPIFAHRPPPTPTPTPPGAAPPSVSTTLHEREDFLDASLDVALRDGTIDKTVGARARLELDAVRYTEDQLRSRHHGQLTDTEAYRLDARLRALAPIIRGPPRGQP